MPRQLTPEETEQRAAATVEKAARRERARCADTLGNLGRRREGLKEATERLVADMATEIPRASRAGVTYDDIARLTGYNRSRVAQIISEAKAAEPEPVEANGDEPDTVPAVDDL